MINLISKWKYREEKKWKNIYFLKMTEKKLKRFPSSAWNNNIVYKCFWNHHISRMTKNPFYKMLSCLYSCHRSMPCSCMWREFDILNQSNLIDIFYSLFEVSSARHHWILFGFWWVGAVLVVAIRINTSRNQ